MNLKVLNYEANINGTSLQGYVTTTRRHLERVFGVPNDGDGGEKVRTEWAITFVNTDTLEHVVATIYDWKSPEPGMDQEYDYHIGGHDARALSAVSQALNLPVRNTRVG